MSRGGVGRPENGLKEVFLVCSLGSMGYAQLRRSALLRSCLCVGILLPAIVLPVLDEGALKELVTL